MTDDSSSFTEAVNRDSVGVDSFIAQPQQLSHDQRSFVQSQALPTSSFGNPLNVTNSSASLPLSGQAGMSTPFSSFGQSQSSSTPPAINGLGSTFVPTPSFGGKSPRELLTAFYQEKNPSKIADVENLLMKYQVRILYELSSISSYLCLRCHELAFSQGREEEMFRNLAKKYSLDPTVFGLPAAPSVPALLTSPPGIAPSPLAFGQPTPLGGGTAFGMGSPPAPSFGAGSGGFGQTFGSVAGASPLGSPSFGALANAPVQSSFGGLATSHQGSLSGSMFGSPTPFGAPRR